MVKYTIKHEIIDGLHVLTSPEVRGLYIAHADERTAYSAVEETVRVLTAINARAEERKRAGRKLAVA